MYCRNCGSPLPEGSSFCPSCGAGQDPSQDRTTVMGGARHAAPGATAPGSTAPASPTSPNATAPATPPTQTMRMPRAQAQAQVGDAYQATRAAVPSPRPSDPYAQAGGERRRPSGNGAVAIVAVALVAAAALAFVFLVVVPGMQRSSAESGEDAATSGILDDVSDPEDADATTDDGDAEGSDKTGADKPADDAGALPDDATPPDATTGTGTGSGTSGASQVSYGAYANGRYGFSVSVPTSFTSYGESDNGDGATFEDAATGATILAWGSNNVFYQDAEGVADTYADGHDLIDRAVYGNAFDLWYRSGSRIVRVHGVVGEGSYNVVQIEYPEDQARQLASVSDYVANSLVAGDLSMGH